MEREKVHRIVEERNLVSLANNTRWASFLARLLPSSVPARLKHVAWPNMSQWSGWIMPATNCLEVLDAGPVHFREIEWVDFDCTGREDERAAYDAAAREARLTSELVGEVVRVLGYRPLG